MPFWTIWQSADSHRKNGRINREHEVAYGYTNKTYDYEHNYMHDPKRGLGQIVIIEADTAREAMDYGIRIGMNRSSGKWSRPRCHMGDSGDDRPRLYARDNHVEDGAHLYIHFKDGTFFQMNGLHLDVARDIITICKEK